MPEIKHILYQRINTFGGGSMYNLLVSGNDDDWNGDPWIIDSSRCVNEYTDESLTQRFGSLDQVSKTALKKLPCIFAYETACRTPPKFGLITDIVHRQRQVRIEYKLIEVDGFISHDDLIDFAVELDIGKWELNRTHWAVKDVDLARELKGMGVKLPPWVMGLGRTVDITTHQFRVALSFPGESRGLVEEIAMNLESLLGPHTYFYDNNYTSQLARPSLDLLLQDIYSNRSDLVVVFIGSNYQQKDWCGIEFRAIREIIGRREHQRVMYVRLDSGPVSGVFGSDGYIDAQTCNASTIAGYIFERLEVLGPSPDYAPRWL